MTDSPQLDSSGVIKLSVFSNSAPIDDTISIESIVITQSINKIPHAKITILDGDMPNKDFPVSNDKTFIPGNEIEIKAGYDQSEDSIFKGIVIRHGLRISGQNNSKLVIECRDKAVAMTIGRHNANYIDSKDSDIITSIISKYGQLNKEVEATTTTHKELVQYYCSDWDFLLSRAEVNGLLICIEDAKLTVKSPQTSATAELALSYGDDILEFQADIDARSQFSAVNAVSWDPDVLAIVEEQAGPASLNRQGNLSSKDLATVVDLKSLRLQSASQLDQSALKDWANGQQIKAGLARIRGNVKFQGNAKARAGSLIDLAGVGERFNGSIFVGSVKHQISQGNWTTEVDFGLPPEWFAEKRDLVAPPASGLIPGVEGLQIGVVMKLDEDPKEQNRIQVSVPILQAETEGVWARLANFYASNTFGNFFIPEIGDEVILGYLNNDPSSPVILGSLYGNKQVPPYEFTANNFTKAIVTKSQLKIEFDDDKKIITITTPGENQFIFSDEDRSIQMQDQNNNKVTLNSDGISLSSPKDIKISAQGQISLDAMDKIDLSAKADISAAGLNVNLDAQVGITAKGSASAELSASGQTTIKGAMVMIN
ncbi:MAG: type VI secretion system tip protein VgrG [Gammaproteobacteria bacterium]|nr:type VI secretion system tip protein VgrG [Gammaproteobacteria bacterium]